MIEGGSRVLSSFLRCPPSPNGSPVVDTVVVTVAPMFIGDGVAVVPKVIACASRPHLFPDHPLIAQKDEHALPAMDTVHTETMGKDAVMVCTLRS